MTPSADAPRPPGAFARFEWMMAWRYLRARRKESVISALTLFSFLGIMLGVATLIIVMAVMNGFRTQLIDRLVGVSGHLVVRAQDGGYLEDYAAIAQNLAEIQGVRQAAPVFEGQVLASGRRGSLGALVRGMKPDDLARTPVISRDIDAQELKAFREEENAVILGNRLARALGLAQGDRVTLLSPRGPVTPFGTAPRARAFTVAGIFSVGMSEIDSAFVLMPLALAQNFFGQTQRATAIEVRLHNLQNAPAFRAPLTRAAQAPVRVRDWRQINTTLASALQVERNVMFLILSLIILVAVLNIISGLVMLVKDKSAEIAMMRAMGASRASVTRIFFIAGAGIGLAGTLAGFLAGLAFCRNIESIRQTVSTLLNTELFSPEIYFLNQLPAQIDPVETALAVFMGVFLSFAATLYPAFRAASLHPAEALRYE